MGKENKLAVITGGTKGIGKALVQALAAEGMDIYTCSRSADDLATLKQEIENDFPGQKVYTQVADLSDAAQCTLFGNAVINLNRKIAVLINNTGYFVPGEVHSEADGTLQRMIETNLYSAYNVSRALIPAMLREKNGHLFTICSVASIVPYVNGGSYCISKFALYGMTKVLREELKPHNIRVTAVLPGATLTDSWAGSGLPEDRFVKPKDVAQTIIACYKLSSQAVVEELIIRPQLGDI